MDKFDPPRRIAVPLLRIHRSGGPSLPRGDFAVKTALTLENPLLGGDGAPRDPKGGVGKNPYPILTLLDRQGYHDE